jgi:hypothetical protein
MNNLRPPLEPAMWPGDLPHPSYEAIHAAVLTAMRLPLDTELGITSEGKPTGRFPPQVLARHMIATICKRVRGMSTPEVADVIGVRSHSQFTGCNGWAAELIHGDFGIAAYNRILENLQYAANGARGA